MNNRKFKVAACHSWKGQKIWAEVGRVTMLSETRGVLRLNMHPDVTYQLFPLDDGPEKQQQPEGEDG